MSDHQSLACAPRLIRCTPVSSGSPVSGFQAEALPVGAQGRAQEVCAEAVSLSMQTRVLLPAALTDTMPPGCSTELGWAGWPQRLACQARSASSRGVEDGSMRPQQWRLQRCVMQGRGESMAF